jgi:hypothetical protein
LKTNVLIPGTLQRFPKVVGNESWTRELAFTGRNFSPEEALKNGFISRIFETQEEMIKESIELARQIAAKSPVAVQGTKHNLIYSRDHTVQEGLEYMAAWNASMLQTKVILDRLNHEGLAKFKEREALCQFMNKSLPNSLYFLHVDVQLTLNNESCSKVKEKGANYNVGFISVHFYFTTHPMVCLQALSWIQAYLNDVY